MFFNGTRNFVLGFTIGFGGGLIAREAFPSIARAIRPAMRGSLRVGIQSMERMREGMAHFGETIEDLLEEVRFDLKNKKAAKRKKKFTTGKAKHRPTEVPSIRIIEGGGAA